MVERGDRVYVKKGPHAGKYGKIIVILGRTAMVLMDNNFGGGTFYIPKNSLEKE
jgi:hypothetical protein